MSDPTFVRARRNCTCRGGVSFAPAGSTKADQIRAPDRIWPQRVLPSAVVQILAGAVQREVSLLQVNTVYERLSLRGEEKKPAPDSIYESVRDSLFDGDKTKVA